jgi:putative phosphoesterase
MKEMKVLLVSDSHGKGNLLNQIIERVSPDHVIHCGDFCTDRDELPSVSLTVVKGNCDWEDVPEEEIWEGAGLRFYITHGDKWRVKSTPLPVKYRGEEMGAQVVCFGHSHHPFCEKIGDILLINPGSISYPRGFAYPTFACLEIVNKQVKVTYHQIDGKEIHERGGIFSF